MSPECPERAELWEGRATGVMSGDTLKARRSRELLGLSMGETVGVARALRAGTKTSRSGKAWEGSRSGNG